MAPTSASNTSSYGDTRDLRRVAIGLAVVAAHVALIFVVGRGTRPAAEVVEITFLPLPITPEETKPITQPKVSSTRPSAPSRMKPQPQNAPRSETQIQESEVAPDTSPTAPAAPIDWYAEARTSADALEQRDRIAHGRRSLDGPTQPPLAGPRHVKPACPFEKCEPNWGTGFSIFQSQATKAGRIEKAPDGEVIRWTSDRCFQILVTPNLMHRGMTKCQMPLKKSGPRGDLFKHMKEAPPPEDRATDVP